MLGVIPIKQAMKKISLDDIEFAEALVEVEMPYEEFYKKFGTKHYDHPDDWNAPGPVELWCFELPWEQKIILELHKDYGIFQIFLGILEIDSILEYLELKEHIYHIRTGLVDRLKKDYPRFCEGLGEYCLYRQDDNNNIVCMKTYETRRVAEYYRKVYEERGHKQTYWVENKAV